MSKPDSPTNGKDVAQPNGEPAQLQRLVSQIFARARGVPCPVGPCRCFYCGCPCDDEYPAKNLVKKSFTSRDTVAGGEYVCGGCVEAMNEKATVTLPDGTVREVQKIRCYSWIVTEKAAVAATKAHRDYLLACCLDPPDLPCVICISDSGQKHLLYRAVVCHSRKPATVTLEAERINVWPDELRKRLGLCKRVAAALGKPALANELCAAALMRLTEHHGDESLPAAWLAVRSEPLTRLATWFTPAKKECEIEYPSIAR